MMMWRRCAEEMGGHTWTNADVDVEEMVEVMVVALVVTGTMVTMTVCAGGGHAMGCEGRGHRRSHDDRTLHAGD